MTTARERAKRSFRKPPVAPAIGPAPRMILRPSDDPAEWGPNAAMAARLMPPPLENLMARGLIAIEHYDAAKEIERVFHWVTAGLKSRMADLTRTGGGTAGTSDPLQAAYTSRYRPWADELSGARIAPPNANQMARVLHSRSRQEVAVLAAAAQRQHSPRRRHHPKTLQFVIDFVIDDRSLEAIAQEEKHHHRTVKRAVLDGLMLYAEIAGWVKRAA